jgi:putative membrane protein
MDTLVICIDRDNDLGEKAKVSSPIIGREENIKAAVALSIADPEDSDSNTIFGGVKVLDELRAKGHEAELVTFAGDKKVGITSDQKISQQLDEVLAKYHASNAIFISDGAEDETLLPIVQSRIKINSVKRIVIIQSENLESTYYVLKHAFNDPKISQTFFVPLGLASLIYSIFLLANYPEGAIIGILAAVGLYMLYRGFGDTVTVLLNKVKDAFHTGRLIAVTHTAALLIVFVAFVQGFVRLWQYYTHGGIWYHGLVPLTTVFIHSSIWWLVLAVIIINFGRMMDKYLHGQFSLRLISSRSMPFP